MKQVFWILWFSFLVSFFTGCGTTFKPAPIAPGNDPVVVNAERAQRSSLDIFRIVTNWEYKNRLSLPPEVSRAIDGYRAEFPNAWNESRLALKQYKSLAGSDPTALNSITAALLAAEASLVKIKQTSNPNEVAQVTAALESLLDSIASFFHKPVSPAVVQPTQP